MKAGSIAAAAWTMALALSACRGAEPVVRDYELKPPESAGAPHLVIVLIENAGHGESEVSVTARLRSKETGRTAAEATAPADLAPHEVLQMTLELRPVLPGPYEISVEAKYPP